MCNGDRKKLLVLFSSFLWCFFCPLKYHLEKRGIFWGCISPAIRSSIDFILRDILAGVAKILRHLSTKQFGRRLVCQVIFLMMINVLKDFKVGRVESIMGPMHFYTKSGLSHVIIF